MKDKIAQRDFFKEESTGGMAMTDYRKTALRNTKTYTIGLVCRNCWHKDILKFPYGTLVTRDDKNLHRCTNCGVTYEEYKTR